MCHVRVFIMHNKRQTANLEMKNMQDCAGNCVQCNSFGILHAPFHWVNVNETSPHDRKESRQV